MRQNLNRLILLACLAVISQSIYATAAWHSFRRRVAGDPAANPQQPSLQCFEEHRALIENAVYLDAGAQGRVYRTTRAGRPVAMKIGVGGHKDFYDGQVHDRVTKTGKEEVEVMKHINKLMDDGKTKGFVRLYDSFMCGTPVNRKSGRITVDVESPPDVQYVVMELLDGKIECHLKSSKMTVKRFAAYLLQSLLSLAIAHREIGFVGRDMFDHIMLYSDPNYAAEKAQKPWFGFVLPNGRRLFIPKQITGGRYTKFIDFGHSILTEHDHFIDTMVENSYQPFLQTAIYERKIDLITVLDDFVMRTPQSFFDKFKKDDPQGYAMFLDLLKSALGSVVRHVIAARRGLRSASPAQAKFISAWKHQRELKTVDLFETYAGSVFAPSRGGFGLDDAVQHPLFTHLFGGNQPADGAIVEYLGMAAK